MTPDDLLAFEEDIAQEFAAGKIRSPIHLGGGSERQLIEIFETIKPHDWVLCGWRSHYHCLLKGVPRDQLKAAILAGHSVSLCFPAHRILCSGIVGGIAPIAVGLAWAIKQRREAAVEAANYAYDSHIDAIEGQDVDAHGYSYDDMVATSNKLSDAPERVHCFLGDMSAESGVVHEAVKYAAGHDLPIRWIIEDNGLSVCTATKASWGLSGDRADVTHYQYTLSRPHAGIGRWVKF